MKTAEMASLQPPHRANDTRAGGPGRVAEEITELVGETPVLHLRKLASADAADVYAKLEYLNPGGSIKDRAALGMITKAERAGKLRPGSDHLRSDRRQHRRGPGSDRKWPRL